LQSGELNASLKHVNASDARYGSGQYFSDVARGTRSLSQLSRDFLGIPFQGSRFTHFIEIDVEELTVVEGRCGVFVVPGELPLNLSGRVVSSGKVSSQ